MGAYMGGTLKILILGILATPIGIVTSNEDNVYIVDRVVVSEGDTIMIKKDEKNTIILYKAGQEEPLVKESVVYKAPRTLLQQGLDASRILANIGRFLNGVANFVSFGKLKNIQCLFLHIFFAVADLI